MSTQNFEDTAPTPISPPAEQVTKPLRWLLVLIGFLMMLLAVGAGSWMGYNSGVEMRVNKQNSDIALKATTQFQLGMQDQIAGNHAMALKRYQYVIQIDPNYPGITEKLAEVMIALAVTASPQPSPTVTLTPTPDTRGEQDLYNAARAALAAQDWAKTIETLDSLRKANIAYNAIQADGMYYIALRNRGMDKIRNGQLEEGIYDMSLTERFGPLDKEADTYRTWARLYITGASFWEIDWEQVINYFSQVYPSTPMLRDSSGMTAADRYRTALIRQAEKLMTQELFCEATEYYELAMQVSPDGNLSATATQVYKRCQPDTATPAPVTPTVEEFPTDEVIPTEETVEPTEETVVPTEETPVVEETTPEP